MEVVQPGGGGGASITVTDGITPVVNVTTINFTSGATITNAGGGQANVAIAGGVTVYNDTVSGTIDSSNKVFTVTHTITGPILLALSNAIYQNTVDYTVTGATQITYTTAPDISLAGQPHWLAHT